ncbi:MAG: FMN-binding protein [Planctomycetota bacterium]|jgi:Na+-transporting NADH:ubiquinone oxidoreductase subunit C
MSKDAKGRPAYVIVYAAVIAAVFTGAIMALHGVTQPVVQRNEQLFEQKAMVELFGLGDVDVLSDQQIVDLYDTRIRREPDVTDPQTGHTFTVFSAVDNEGELIGHAFSITGTGFWARIDGYLAVNPDMTEIIGITFLQHQETPGLGGRITEEEFCDQFDGLDFSEPVDGLTVTIRHDAPAPDSPAAARHVDAITGATGTSSALERFLNEQIAAYRRAEAEEASE